MISFMEGLCHLLLSGEIVACGTTDINRTQNNTQRCTKQVCNIPISELSGSPGQAEHNTVHIVSRCLQPLALAQLARQHPRHTPSKKSRAKRVRPATRPALRAQGSPWRTGSTVVSKQGGATEHKAKDT